MMIYQLNYYTCITSKVTINDLIVADDDFLLSRTNTKPLSRSWSLENGNYYYYLIGKVIP